jgi:tungstate transport system substrate-binding protein
MRRILPALMMVLVMSASAAAQSSVVILSTTTSTQDSGLLDVLVPMFEKKARMTVKTISVGTGQALALAGRGEADVTLAHGPAVEKKYVEEGKMQNRRLVMYNDFVIIGPEADTAKIKGLPKAVDALKRCRQRGALRLPGRQVRHAHARARVVEAGGRRTQGGLVHRVRAGHGPDAGHCQ